MNTINSNPGVRTSPTGGVEDPNIAAHVAAQQPAVYQPYVFVDGEPPPDVGVPPAGANTVGLSPPRRAALLPREIDNLSANLGAMIAMNPTSTTEANTYASLFAMQDVMIRMMLQLRTDSLKNRDDEMVVMREKKTLAIEKGMDAAKMDLAAGITSGVGQFAAGLGSTVGGFKGEGLTGGTVAQGKFSGFGAMANGLATGIAAGLTYAGSQIKAEQQRAELAAEQASQRLSQANERAAAQLEALRSIAQSQLAIVQTNVEAVKRTYA